MHEIKEFSKEEIGVKLLKKFLWGLEKKIWWNLTLKMKIFSRSETLFLYVSAFQVLGVEIDLQIESYGKNAKLEKSHLSLNTCVQYVEDFKFWVLATGNAHTLPEREIVIFL